MKKNILIVEDEALIALDLKRTLIKKGFDVIGISDSHEKTLELIKMKKNCEINLILMDINIKGSIDGIQSCNIIFNKYKIKTLFISAYYADETLTMVKDSHAIGFIFKPIKYNQLLIYLHFLLKNTNSKKNITENKKIYLSNGFSFNLLNNSLYMNNKELFLTKIEKKLLFILCKNKYNFISYEILFAYIWENEKMSLNKIRGTVFRLKRKIPLLNIINSKELGYKIE